MEAVKEWVKSLVLLVLLAGCLELLLPMNSMKKYVRMTMGLLVVLGVIQPVFTLLGQPLPVTANLLQEKPSGRLPTVSEIMAMGRKIQEKNLGLAGEEARITLGAAAAEAARTVDGVAGATADVAVEMAGGEYKVTAVTLKITPGAGVQPIKPIEPIAPIGGGGGTSAPAARQQSEAERALAEAVRREVAARLGLRPDPRLIRVQLTGQPEAQRR